jgi:pimeloyl-ACP methyl ester carboxylesterase
VERLVLVSAAGVTWARVRREPAAVVGRLGRAAAPLVLRYRMEGLRRSRLRHLAYRGVFHDPRALRPELLWEQTVPALRSPGFQDAVTTLFGYDIRDRLVEIEVPTLIVWGTGDVFFETVWAEWLRDTIPGAEEIVLLEGGKLFFPYERADEFVPHLRRHWAVHAAVAPLEDRA